MEIKRRRINSSSVYLATDLAKRRIEAAAGRSSAALIDSERDDRRAAGLCPFCYYYAIERIGGAAITRQACGTCGEVMVFGSTRTDALCLSCSRRYDLCKRCGGDLDMKHRRTPRDLPTPDDLP